MELREVYKKIYGGYPMGRPDRVSAVMSLVKPASSPMVASVKDIAETLKNESRKRRVFESMLDIGIDGAGYLTIDNERVLLLAAVDNGREFTNDSLAYYAEGRILARQERDEF